MPSKIYIKEENIPLLKQLYSEENKSLDEISKVFNAHRTVITRWVRELNLKRNYKDPEWITQKHHVEKLTLTKICELANCGREGLRKTMRDNNIDTLDEVKYSGVTKYDKDYMYFDSIDTHEKAYWLGFIMADGCIVHESCDTYRLSIILAQKDKNHLEKFRTCINALDTPIVDNESTLKVTDKTYYNSRIRINNSYMCKALMNLNVLPNKSGNEKTPNIEPRFYPSFIRGYFDGDGCFTFKYDHRNLSWECNIVIVGGFEILNFISETIYEYLKIYSEIHQDGSIYRIGIGGVNQVEDIMDWLYSYEGPVLERKFYKYMEWHKTKNYE